MTNKGKLCPVSPYRRFSLWALGLFIASFPAVFFIGELSALFSFLIALNISTFLLFGYDKRAAMSGFQRVPERVLLVLGLLGGSLAIIVGSSLLRHKTKDKTFLPKFTVVCALQAGLLKLLGFL